VRFLVGGGRWWRGRGKKMSRLTTGMSVRIASSSPSYMHPHTPSPRLTSRRNSQTCLPPTPSLPLPPPPPPPPPLPHQPPQASQTSPFPKQHLSSLRALSLCIPISTNNLVFTLTFPSYPPISEPSDREIEAVSEGRGLVGIWCMISLIK
jgi:hypothetical protein